MTFTVSSVVSVLLGGCRENYCRGGSTQPRLFRLHRLHHAAGPSWSPNTQDGIARAHDWMRLGLMPQFIVASP